MCQAESGVSTSYATQEDDPCGQWGWGSIPGKGLGRLPSSKYPDVCPPAMILRRASDPVRAVLPRKQRRGEGRPLKGIREADPMTACLLGPGRGGTVGELVLGKTIKYIGAVVAGRPHGTGKSFERSTAGNWCLRYEGTWCQGRREGAGTAHYSCGKCYTGDWRANEHHGVGEIKYPNGSSYTGNWSHGMQHGVGTHRHANGDTFTGMFILGKREGLGTLYCPSQGRKYTAEYVADQPFCGVWEDWTEGCNGATAAEGEKCPSPQTLPALHLLEPFQALAETIGARRVRHVNYPGNSKASTIFTAMELQNLQHNFTRLAGAVGDQAMLRPNQFRQVCMAAGLTTAHPKTQAFLDFLEEAAGGNAIQHDRFVEAILKFRC